jgi:hypothetical protein
MQEVEQDKFRFEISKVINKQIGESKLYGWGNNKWGQLGIYGANNIPEPKLIPLPDLNPEKSLPGSVKDYIV